MKGIYICKAVDETDPYVATQVRWIRSLASCPDVECLTVLAPRCGKAALPSNVSVRVFGRRQWPWRAVSFYRALLRGAPHKVDFFLIAQGGGPYPLLLLPMRLLTGAPICHWKAHPHISPRMRFYARYADDLIFTATPESFPLDLEKIHVVGHGIDTDLFRPSNQPKECDLLALGRISRVKRIDWIVRAISICRDRFGSTPTLDILGPCPSKDWSHLEQLRADVQRLDLEAQIRFLPPVDHAALPALLPQYRAIVNFSQTAFDKSAGEAMAAGVPVVTTNRCTAEVIPQQLRHDLVADEDDVEAQADALHRVLSRSEAERRVLGGQLRDAIVKDHSLDSFFGKILKEIRASS